MVFHCGNFALDLDVGINCAPVGISLGLEPSEVALIDKLRGLEG